MLYDKGCRMANSQCVSDISSDEEDQNNFTSSKYENNRIEQKKDFTKRTTDARTVRRPLYTNQFELNHVTAESLTTTQASTLKYNENQPVRLIRVGKKALPTTNTPSVHSPSDDISIPSGKVQTSATGASFQPEVIKIGNNNRYNTETDSDSEADDIHIQPLSQDSNSLLPSNQSLNNNQNFPQLSPEFAPLFHMITEELERFAFMPAPRGLGDIQCKIRRDKQGIEKGFFPTYFMYVERPTDGKAFPILAARKRRRTAKSNYLISTDPTDLTRGESFCAKLRSNVIGTQFTIYDRGVRPGNNHPVEDQRRELAAIAYEANVLGFKGPRKMTVIIPGINGNLERIEVRPTRDSESLIERWKRKEMENLVALNNKAPVWNEETKAYVLNFQGRVTKASVKNFQIIDKAEQDYICMQFGRTNTNEFTCDYKFPLCAVQAFGIALSSFDGKLACE